MNRCRTCKFYEPFHPDSTLGLCRRYPPTAGTDPERWARVVEEEWCGEHRQLAFPRDKRDEPEDNGA